MIGIHRAFELGRTRLAHHSPSVRRNVAAALRQSQPAPQLASQLTWLAALDASRSLDTRVAQRRRITV